MNDNKSTQHRPTKAPVVDLFSKQPLQPSDEQRLLRICPEFDDISMLYSNDAHAGKVFKLRLIAWGLQKNGDIVGLVPWLNSVTACPTLTDPLNGHWEGYYDSLSGEVFYDAPPHKTTELHAAYDYFCEHHHYSSQNIENDPVIQEIPDQIGTHAVFNYGDKNTFFVTAVFSWQLHLQGLVEGMLIDPAKVEKTPVLAGDDSLYPVSSSPGFKYFFQYTIANKIKNQDPDALKAISALIKF